VEGIIFLLDLMQPHYALPIYFLQRCPINRKVGVRPRILQVLDGGAQIVYAAIHIAVVVVVVVIQDSRWDGAGTVRRVRGWCPMREDVGLEWLNVEGHHDVLIFLAQIVTQGLQHKPESATKDLALAVHGKDMQQEHWVITDVIYVLSRWVFFAMRWSQDIPSLPLTTTFPIRKTALRPEVTLPSPTKLSLQWDLGSSELVGASRVQCGVWEGSSLWKTVLRPEDTPSGDQQGMACCLAGCLRFSQLLWALKGVFGPTLVAINGGLYPLSLSPHSSTTTLSRGPEKPLYPTFLVRLHS
jgi:hypothetical protein